MRSGRHLAMPPVWSIDGALPAPMTDPNDAIEDERQPKKQSSGEIPLGHLPQCQAIPVAELVDWVIVPASAAFRVGIHHVLPSPPKAECGVAVSSCVSIPMLQERERHATSLRACSFHIHCAA